MENLTVDTSKTIATVLLRQLIDPEQVALHFNMEGEAREALLQETKRALEHLETYADFQATLNIFTPRLHDRLNALAQESASVKKETHLQKAASAASKQNVTPYELSESINITGLLTPSLLLASAVLDMLSNPHQFRDKEQLVKCSTSLLVNTNQVIQNSAIQGLTLTLGSITAVGIGLGVGIMREYRFRLDKREYQAQLAQTITTAEDAYLEIHKNYAIMCMAYQARINQIKFRTVFDEAEYRQIIDAWLATERYYQGQIQLHQKEIANISAVNQRMHSSHRLDRAMDTLNTFLTLTAFSGPPGLLAATIIRAFAGIGLTLSNLVIQDTARFNHGIRHENSIVLLSDTDSIEDAIEVLGHTINPFIGLSGPILRPFKIAGFNIDALLYTHAALAKKLVMQAKGRPSCSFSFSTNLPEIPKATLSASAAPYSLNTELRQSHFKVLKELVAVATTLIDEGTYLWFLGWELRKIDSIWPYVVNYQDLIFALSESAQEIDEQLAVILNHMGDNTVKTAEETRLIAELKRKTVIIEDRCNNELKKQSIELQKTPHNVLFNEGMAIHLQEASLAELRKIKDTYYAHPEARNHWLNEICFHLDGINQLINACLSINVTRYLQNLNQVIVELRTNIDILNQIYAEHDNSHFSTQELTRCQRAENSLHRIAIQNQLLMKDREKHITLNPNGLDCPQDRYVELIKLQHQRLLGNRATPSILEESNHPDHVSRRFLTHLESRLVQPTPVHLDELENIRIISPNRTFFGMRKHQDMKRDVTAKLEALLQSSTSPLKLQIMPLQGVDEPILASCRSNYQRLNYLIEGLKTEIQWVTQLQHISVLRDVKVINVDSTYEFYQQQISMFRKICLNKPTILGQPLSTSSFFSKISTYTTHVQNSLHENVFHDAEVQLMKAKNVIEQWQLAETEHCSLGAA